MAHDHLYKILYTPHRLGKNYTMGFADILSRKVKPELNHIYTEPPQPGDCGWYCREHALHLYGVAVLMQKTAEICLGDYILQNPNRNSYTSVSSESDHAWCRIEGCALVDVSMTVKHLYPDISDIALVYENRPDLADGFIVNHRVGAPDNQFLELVNGDSRMIAYNEKSRLSCSLIDLLSNPFQFLHKPRQGPNFQEIYDADVFYAITHHCYRLVTENQMPLYHYRNPKSTVTQIMKYNPKARGSIEALLAPESG